MSKHDTEKDFETLLLNEQLSKVTIEERMAEFDLPVEDAAKVREFQETRKFHLLFKYLLLRGKAKRYFRKYGDYFAF